MKERNIPTDKREDLLVQPPELSSLPQKCRARVINIVARLGRERPPKEFQDETLLYASLITRELFKSLKGFKEPQNSWGQTLRSGVDSYVFFAAMNADRLEAMKSAQFWAVNTAQLSSAVERVEWLSASGGGLSFYSVAESAAAWGTVSDKIGFGDNPFSHILSLFELGAIRVGFREVNRKEKLVVDFPYPLGRSDTGMSACLVFGSDGSRDKKVRYCHRNIQDCSKILPLDQRLIFRPRVIR